jgi:multiple sugar transport system substrate-binding protein
MDQDNAGQPANLAMLQQRFSQFEATFPGTKISFEAAGQNGSGTQAKFQVVLAAGTLPDVLCTHTAFAEQYPQLADLVPFFSKDRTLKSTDYFPTALGAFNVPINGTPRQVAIPRETHVTLLYYNRDTLKAAGLREPPRDWTHTQFVDFALKLRTWTSDPTTAVWAVSAMNALGGANGGLPLYWSHGAEFFGDDGRQCLIDRPEARQALQWLQDLVVTTHISPSPQEDAASGLSSSQPDRLATNRVAMYASNVNTSPLVATGGALAIDWDIQALPQVPGHKRATCLAAPGYAIVTQGQNKNPDLAWELIKHLDGEEGARQWIEASGLLMAHKRASQAWATHRGPSKNSQVAFDILDNWARLEQTRLRGWTQAMVPIGREWTAVLNGQRSIGEMIGIAKPEAEAALAQAQASA